jgi:predicted dehydrogenase
MSKKSFLWLIGTGHMAQNYAKVLKSLKHPFKVIGRGKNSALIFKKKTGVDVKIGGLKLNIKKANIIPNVAIVAVDVENLADVTRDLIYSGVKYILLEKPGALNFQEIYSLNLLATQEKVNVLIAYNRRFYNSVSILRNLIKQDGGILSMNYEFTEWSHIIKLLKKNSKVKKSWLIANSSHIIDLAFHFCGRPKNWKYWHAGKNNLNWHPSSARFCGAGVTDKGIIFTYNSDWQAPGRWSLEFKTIKRRFILKPIEQLQVIKLGSLKLETIKQRNNFDKKFMPGLYLQTRNFIKKDFSHFCLLSEQVKNIKIYGKIAGYL